MNITKRFIWKKYDADQELEYRIQYWRKRICRSIFIFLTVFGFVAYVPSVYLALRDGYTSIVILDTIAYFVIIAITVLKSIPYRIKAAIGSLVFYFLGILLLIILGPMGAGNLWLFTFSLVTGLTLGEKASILSLILNTVTQLTLFVFHQHGLLTHGGMIIVSADIYLARAVNFIPLNFVIVIANIIFVKGFKLLLNQSEESRRATILGLARLAEHRDTDTGEHLQRISIFTTILTGALGEIDEYSSYITNEYIRDMAMSSILHDIGKVGIQDAVLLKEGPLTKEEFDEIKKHPSIGAEVISEIEKNINGRSLYLLGREIAEHHHEKWDGSGYPDGLKGKDIPLSARIVALTDVYDALTSERPYKKAFSHEKAVEIITKERGKHFDPQITDVFLAYQEEFRKFPLTMEGQVFNTKKRPPPRTALNTKIPDEPGKRFTS